MFLLDPAFATGGLLGALFTLIFTCAFATPPLSSVTVSSKIYCPACKPETVVLAAAASEILAVPPLIFAHLYETIVPSGSTDFVPSSAALLTGSVIDWPDPASATGNLLIAELTVIITESDPVLPLLSVTTSLKI